MDHQLMAKEDLNNVSAMSISTSLEIKARTVYESPSHHFAVSDGIFRGGAGEGSKGI
jgi:hypothetical protein